MSPSYNNPDRSDQNPGLELIGSEPFKQKYKQLEANVRQLASMRLEGEDARVFAPILAHFNTMATQYDDYTISEDLDPYIAQTESLLMAHGVRPAAAATAPIRARVVEHQGRVVSDTAEQEHQLDATVKNRIYLSKLAEQGDGEARIAEFFRGIGLSGSVGYDSEDLARAIREYQDKHGLTCDGWVNPEFGGGVWDHVMARSASSSTPMSSPSGTISARPVDPAVLVGGEKAPDPSESLKKNGECKVHPSYVRLGEDFSIKDTRFGLTLQVPGEKDVSDMFESNVDLPKVGNDIVVSENWEKSLQENPKIPDYSDILKGAITVQVNSMFADIALRSLNDIYTQTNKMYQDISRLLTESKEAGLTINDRPADFLISALDKHKAIIFTKIKDDPRVADTDLAGEVRDQDYLSLRMDPSGKVFCYQLFGETEVSIGDAVITNSPYLDLHDLPAALTPKAAIATSQTQAPEAPDENPDMQEQTYTLYLIKGGDTLDSIAQEAGTTKALLLTINTTLEEDAIIKPGSSLRVPVKTYIIKTGDTISEVARGLGVTRSKLMEINGLEEPPNIYIGDGLIVPGKSTAMPSLSSISTGLPGMSSDTESNPQTNPKDFDMYKVQNGDTLEKCAGYFFTTTEILIELNKLGENTTLTVGQELVVPTKKYFEHHNPPAGVAENEGAQEEIKPEELIKEASKAGISKLIAALDADGADQKKILDVCRTSLVNTKNNNGFSALHNLASYWDGWTPELITQHITLLKDTKSNNGFSTLHTLAFFQPHAMPQNIIVTLEGIDLIRSNLWHEGVWQSSNRITLEDDSKIDTTRLQEYHIRGGKIVHVGEAHEAGEDQSSPNIPGIPAAPTIGSHPETTKPIEATRDGCRDALAQIAEGAGLRYGIGLWDGTEYDYGKIIKHLPTIKEALAGLTTEQKSTMPPIMLGELGFFDDEGIKNDNGIDHIEIDWNESADDITDQLTQYHTEILKNTPKQAAPIPETTSGDSKETPTTHPPVSPPQVTPSGTTLPQGASESDVGADGVLLPSDPNSSAR